MQRWVTFLFWSRRTLTYIWCWIFLQLQAQLSFLFLANGGLNIRKISLVLKKKASFLEGLQYHASNWVYFASQPIHTWQFRLKFCPNICPMLLLFMLIVDMFMRLDVDKTQPCLQAYCEFCIQNRVFFKTKLNCFWFYYSITEKQSYLFHTASWAPPETCWWGCSRMSGWSPGRDPCWCWPPTNQRAPVGATVLSASAS